jgi:hypothetical protein
MIKDELLTGDKDEGASHFAELNRELALRAHEENRQRQTDARKAAIDSANVAIRALLLVNGGAVVALLAFIGAMEAGESAAISLDSLVEPVWFFAIGTGLSAVVSALAYLVNMFDSDIISSVKLTWQHPYVEKKPVAWWLFRSRTVVFCIAFLLAVGSLVSFFLGIWSVTSAIQHLEM